MLSRLSGILADARIPLLALSTHDTDWILVRSTHVDAARVAFESAGIPVSDADQDASEVT